MKHPLYVGQVFRCAAFGELDRHMGLKHRYEWVGGALVRDEHVLMPDESSFVYWTRHEEKDGWKREVEEKLDLLPTVTDLGTRLWTVVRVTLEGGGTAHGPYDVFPDRHHVVARSADLEVRFQYDGVGIRPEQVELVEGVDLPGKWVRTYEVPGAPGLATRAGKWFGALSPSDRKTLLVLLHELRTVCENRGIDKHLSLVLGLLRALDDDHQALKNQAQH